MTKKLSRFAQAAAAVALAASLALTTDAALARRKPGLLEQAVEAIEDHHSYKVPATGAIEVAFSPNEGSDSLVIKVIDSSRSQLRVLAYSFTSAPVTQAMLRAKHRGVDVKLVADYKANVQEDKSGKARAALSALATAGVDVRTIKVYPIHHDKVVVADAETVELGSFNYSDAAAHRNSENVMVNWRNPQLAKVYLDHFARNYRQSDAYQLAY